MPLALLHLPEVQNFLPVALQASHGQHAPVQLTWDGAGVRLPLLHILQAKVIDLAKPRLPGSWNGANK